MARPGRRRAASRHARARLPLLAALTALALVLAHQAPAAAEPRFPPLTGRIVDDAGLLGAKDRAEIQEMLAALEAKSTDQLVVYTTRSLQGYPIEEIGYRLGRAWGIGQKGTNNGVLLIVAPGERKVRIEVGRGLEPQMTDLMSKLIIDNAILPAFRRNDFAGGIKAGVRDIRDVLLGDAEAVKERARAAQKRHPGGEDNAELIIVLLVVAFIIFVVWMQARQARGRPSGARARRSHGDVIPLPGGWGGAGSWPSGGGSSRGGGGWSGGGGDFGGGGASGSW